MKEALKVIFIFAAILLFSNKASAQNSNIGTEFWTGYMDHIDGAGVNGSRMILYIASDVATTVTISIADGSYNSGPINIVPNKIVNVIVPASAFLGDNQGITTKGIHIVSKDPVAVYAHIYENSVSGATLLLPVNTLATDYYSINYKQVSNQTPAYSTFMVIATEDNTTVEINPSADLINGEVANVAFNINLQKGQIYQGLSLTDLTGTKIRSISTTTSACKRIAVFSGSSKISIGSSSRITNGGRGSADNLIQQAYPTASWGKNFITAPLKSRDYDIFRIVISDPTTKVTLNGTTISLTQFVNNFYYEFKSQSTNIISADKPIQVIQYSVTEHELFDGTSDLTNTDVGDPEMIYLNPIEQNIDHVTLYSTGKYRIITDFINVIIPTAAVASFKLDGVSQTGAFSAVNNKPSYSYAQLKVDTGVTHFISASQGFNAIAYGFGQFESYGYAAGTNIKNLNEFVQFVDTATNKVVNTGCTGLGFIPQVTLPYITTRLIWDFGNNKKDTLLAPINTPLPPKADGTILYQYKYNKPITYFTPSIYVVKVTATDPITTVCGSDEDIYLNYTISDPPKAKFSARDSICLTDTIGFKDLTDTTVNHIKSWHWNFGTSNIADTSAIQSPVFTYKTLGLFTVTLTVIGNTGCTTTTSKNVFVKPSPVAGYKIALPICESPLTVSFKDTSQISKGKNTSWFWDFGDKTTSLVQNPVHTYASAATYKVTLTVFSDKNCVSSASNTIVVNFSPKVDFSIPDVCQQDQFAHFTALVSVKDSVSDDLTYAWDFGDAANAPKTNTATGKVAQHHYSNTGTYKVKLTVTTSYGCVKDTIKQLTVNGSSPKAAFTVSKNTCSNKNVIFTTNADVPGFNNGKITSFTIDFGDGTPPPPPFRIDSGKMFNHKYPIEYTSSKTYKVLMTAYSGATCMDTVSHYINLLPVPKTTFNLPAKICQKADSLLLASFVSGQTGGPAAKPSFLIDNKFSVTGVFNPSTQSIGTHTVTCYNIADITQCADTIIKNITVEPIAKISAGPNQTILAGAQVKLKATSTGSNILWSPSTGLSDAKVLNPIASPLVDTKYTLTATLITDSVSCPVSDTVTVKVLQPPVIPNTFTPNGDLINDTWKIKYLDTYPGCTVDVYDRNGAKVFSSIGYGIPWDGRFNYINLPVGTYYYIIDPKNGRDKISGSVTIIR